MFDATGSLIDYGDTWVDRAAYQFPPALTDIQRGAPPLADASIEPLQMIAAAPLYALAKALPGLGLLHTVWLFNGLVTAAAAVVLFWYVIALGYHERTAAVSALLLGTATVVVPYAKTFFREPLLLLALLSAALALERLRTLHFRSVGWAVMAALAIAAVTLTKASGLLALPALLLIALPTLHRIDRRAVLILGGALALTLGVFVLFGVAEIIPALSERYSILRRLTGLETREFGTALAAYLLSPGGSLWGTSPVLLLALPGAVLLIRAGRWRLVLAALTLIGAFAIGYALLNGDFWFGGLAWPPRFLVPVVPFAWLLAVPVIDWLLKRPIRWLLIAPLLAYSLYVQAAGVLIFGADYADFLPPEANRFVHWAGGLYDPRYFRWSLLPDILAARPPDLAWWTTNAPQWPLSMAALLIAALGLLIAALRGHTSRVLTGAIMTLPIAWVLLTGLHLGRLYVVDARYLSADESLHRAVAILQSETRPDDVILLSSPRYAAYFLNAAPRRGTLGRVIALPLQPGERPSPEEPPLIESAQPAHLLQPETLALINRLAADGDRLWLVGHGTPELWWSTRPVERYLSAYFYPVRYWTTGDNTRVIEYATVPAPEADQPYLPTIPVGLTYDAVLHLHGVELPAGTLYAPGDALPVSLYWSLDQAVEANYTIALFLRHADGSPVTQYDGQPLGGFAPTSGWQPGQPVWDHRALIVPADLLPGEYTLWVKVYDFLPDGSSRDLVVTVDSGSAAAVREDVIGVLGVTITVTAPQSPADQRGS